MKIFENYNTAKQKYGEELANSVLSNGIPNEYVYTACRYYTEDNIPIDVLLQKFRQWMSYVRNLGKETFNVNNLSYQQFDNIIRGEIQKAMKPNPIYDDGTIFMGEFKTKEDALLYPIPNEWCTSNSSSKYNQYVGNGYRLFVIENKSLDEPLKYVCASVYNGRVIYWDVNDNQLYEDLRDYTNVNNSEHETYQRTLPKQIVDYLYNIAAEQTDEMGNKQNINSNLNMNKKFIRLTESDLHNIVKESVEQVLMEIGDTERGQYALGALQAKKDNLARQEFQRGSQFNNKYSTYKPDVHARERRKEVNGGSEFDTTNMENYYKAKDMYNAYIQGYRNYMSSMNNSAAEDYRTAKIRH